MALDGIFLSKIKDELLREAAFGRVEKSTSPPVRSWLFTCEEKAERSFSFQSEATVREFI